MNSCRRNRRWKCRPDLCGTSRAEEHCRFRLKSITLRRSCIFLGTAALTVAGCYEYMRFCRSAHHALEAMVLVLFVLLFAWVAFSFMSALRDLWCCCSGCGTRSGSIRRTPPGGEPT